MRRYYYQNLFRLQDGKFIVPVSNNAFKTRLAAMVYGGIRKIQLNKRLKQLGSPKIVRCEVLRSERSV